MNLVVDLLHCADRIALERTQSSDVCAGQIKHELSGAFKVEYILNDSNIGRPV